MKAYRVVVKVRVRSEREIVVHAQSAEEAVKIVRQEGLEGGAFERLAYDVCATTRLGKEVHHEDFVATKNP